MSYVYVLKGPDGYPTGMDIHRVWTWTQFFVHGFFHRRTNTVFTDVDMDMILFNPIQTRPIAILTGGCRGLWSGIAGHVRVRSALAGS